MWLCRASIKSKHDGGMQGQLLALSGDKVRARAVVVQQQGLDQRADLLSCAAQV